MNSPEYSPRVPDPAGEAVDSGRGRIFPCQKCGSDLTFHIGQQMLDCRHCGHRQAIGFPSDASAVVEHDYVKSVTMQASQKRALVDAPQEHNEVRCESCGAHVLFEGTLTSTSCPYCGSPIQRENIHRGGFRIPVDGVLAFQIEQGIARTRLKAWISSRWFAPNDFKKAATDDHFQGVYLPFWTFDSLTSTRFSGQRGDRYSEWVGSGKERKLVSKTRWTAVSGQFQHFFDDTLVQGIKDFPTARLREIEPWPLEKCRSFTAEYLAGFFARTYDVDLEDACVMAKSRMEDELRSDCKRRIGGNEQRLSSMEVHHDAVTYKHLLLPVWIVAYRYHEKSYRVFINAVTGQASGDRPYSWVKISLAILAACVVMAVIVLATR